MVRIALALLVAVSLAACGDSKQERGPDNMARPMSVWTKSGTCSEEVTCERGEAIAQWTNHRSHDWHCPLEHIAWCSEGFACDPDDKTPCMRLDGTAPALDRMSAKCASGRPPAIPDRMHFTVFVCAESGTWRPTHQYRFVPDSNLGKEAAD